MAIQDNQQPDTPQDPEKGTVAKGQFKGLSQEEVMAMLNRDDYVAGGAPAYGPMPEAAAGEAASEGLQWSDAKDLYRAPVAGFQTGIGETLNLAYYFGLADKETLRKISPWVDAEARVQTSTIVGAMGREITGLLVGGGAVAKGAGFAAKGVTKLAPGLKGLSQIPGAAKAASVGKAAGYVATPVASISAGLVGAARHSAIARNLANTMATSRIAALAPAASKRRRLLKWMSAGAAIEAQVFVGEMMMRDPGDGSFVNQAFGIDWFNPDDDDNVFEAKLKLAMDGATLGVGLDYALRGAYQVARAINGIRKRTPGALKSLKDSVTGKAVRDEMDLIEDLNVVYDELMEDPRFVENLEALGESLDAAERQVGKVSESERIYNRILAGLFGDPDLSFGGMREFREHALEDAEAFLSGPLMKDSAFQQRYERMRAKFDAKTGGRFDPVAESKFKRDVRALAERAVADFEARTQAPKVTLGGTEYDPARGLIGRNPNPTDVEGFGQDLIYLFQQADVTTLAHELMHRMRRRLFSGTTPPEWLADGALQDVADAINRRGEARASLEEGFRWDEDKAVVLNEDGTWPQDWSVEADEILADMMEVSLREGNIPGLPDYVNDAFELMKERVAKVYEFLVADSEVRLFGGIDDDVDAVMRHVIERQRGDAPLPDSPSDPFYMDVATKQRVREEGRQEGLLLQGGRKIAKVAQVVESRPGATSALFKGMQPEEAKKPGTAAADPKVTAALQDATDRALGRGTGAGIEEDAGLNDVVLARVGGLYEGVVSPGTGVVSREAVDDLGVLTPEAVRKVNVYATTNGTLLRQDASAWHTVLEPGTPIEKAHGLMFDLGRAGTDEDVARIQAKMSEVNPELHGHIAPVATPYGVNTFDYMITSPDEISDKSSDYLETMQEIVEEVLGDDIRNLPAERGFKSQANYIDNDWSKDINGEGYLRYLPADDRTAAENILRKYAPRVDEAYHRFADEYGGPGIDASSIRTENERWRDPEFLAQGGRFEGLRAPKETSPRGKVAARVGGKLENHRKRTDPVQRPLNRINKWSEQEGQPREADDENIALIKKLRNRWPNILKSRASFIRFMAEFSGEDVGLMAPENLITGMKPGGYVQETLRGMTPEQIDAASRGLDLSVRVKESLRRNDDPNELGALLAWSHFSRMASPFPHEAAFLDTMLDPEDSLMQWIEAARKGEFDLEEYLAWTKRKLPGKDSGLPGAGESPGTSVQSNGNDFGRNFLALVNDRAINENRDVLREMLDVWNSDMSSADVVADVYRIMNNSAGLGNKLMHFARLASGHHDVVVVDRIQFRSWFDITEERAKALGFEEKVTETVNPETGKITKTKVSPEAQMMTAIDNFWHEGPMGLHLYGGYQRSFDEALAPLYAEVPELGEYSAGRAHWQLWIASQGSEVEHETLRWFVDRKIVPIAERRFDEVQSGFIYDPELRKRAAHVEGLPDMWAFSKDAYAEVRDNLRSPSRGVVPPGWSMAKRINAEEKQNWYFSPEVDAEGYGLFLASRADGIYERAADGSFVYRDLTSAERQRTAAAYEAYRQSFGYRRSRLAQDSAHKERLAEYRLTVKAGKEVVAQVPEGFTVRRVFEHTHDMKSRFGGNTDARTQFGAKGEDAMVELEQESAAAFFDRARGKSIGMSEPTLADLEDAKMIMSADGTAGIAIGGPDRNEIVALWGDADAIAKGRVDQMIDAGIRLGARRGLFVDGDEILTKLHMHGGVRVAGDTTGRAHVVIDPTDNTEIYLPSKDDPKVGAMDAKSAADKALDMARRIETSDVLFQGGRPMHRTSRRNRSARGRRAYNPRVQRALLEYEAGDITHQQYREIVRDEMPVEPFTAVPDTRSDEQIRNVLVGQQVGRVGAHRKLPAGTRVATRIDIKAFQKSGEYVVSVHEPKADFSAGRSIGYDNAVRMTNVEMGMPQSTGAVDEAAQKFEAGEIDLDEYRAIKDQKGPKVRSVHQGGPKSTFATIVGDYQPGSQADVRKLAKKAMRSKEWRQVGMDPERHAYFYDRLNTDVAIVGADEVIQVGGLVLAKNARTASPDGFLFQGGREKLTGYHGTTYARLFEEGLRADPDGVANGRAMGSGTYFASRLELAQRYGKLNNHINWSPPEPIPGGHARNYSFDGIAHDGDELHGPTVQRFIEEIMADGVSVKADTAKRGTARFRLSEQVEELRVAEAEVEGIYARLRTLTEDDRRGPKGAELIAQREEALERLAGLEKSQRLGAAIRRRLPGGQVYEWQEQFVSQIAKSRRAEELVGYVDELIDDPDVLLSHTMPADLFAGLIRSSEDAEFLADELDFVGRKMSREPYAMRGITFEEMKALVGDGSFEHLRKSSVELARRLIDQERQILDWAIRQDIGFDQKPRHHKVLIDADRARFAHENRLMIAQSHTVQNACRNLPENCHEWIRENLIDDAEWWKSDRLQFKTVYRELTQMYRSATDSYPLAQQKVSELLDYHGVRGSLRVGTDFDAVLYNGSAQWDEGVLYDPRKADVQARLQGGGGPRKRPSRKVRAQFDNARRIPKTVGDLINYDRQIDSKELALQLRSLLEQAADLYKHDVPPRTLEDEYDAFVKEYRLLSETTGIAGINDIPGLDDPAIAENIRSLSAQVYVLREVLASVGRDVLEYGEALPKAGQRTAMERAQMLRMMQVHQTVFQTVKQAQAEISMALRSQGIRPRGDLQVGKLYEVKTDADAIDLVDAHGGSNAVDKRIDQQLRVAQAEAAVGNPAKVRFTPWDMLAEMVQNNYLSGLSSINLNVTSGALRLISDPIEDLGGNLGMAILHAIKMDFGGSRASLEEVKRVLIAAAMLPVDAIDAIRMTAVAFKGDAPQYPGSAAAWTEHGPASSVRAWSAAGQGLDPAKMGGVPAMALNGVGALVNLPSRLNMTSDQFFKSLTVHRNMRMHFMKQVAGEGLTGVKAAREVRRRMNEYFELKAGYTVDAMRREARRQGMDSGLQGDDLKKFVDGFVAKNWNEQNAEAFERSLDKAHDATFSNPADRRNKPLKSITDRAFGRGLRRTLGTVAQAISTARQKSKGANVFAAFYLPFVSTPTNLLNFTFDRSLGLVSDSLAVIKDKMAGEALDPEVAKDLMGRMATGGLLVSLAGHMATSKDDAGRPLLTGAAPADAAEREMWKALGIQADSMLIDGEYLRLSQLDPWGNFFSTAANIATTIEKHPELTENAFDFTIGLATAVANSLANKNYLAGLGKLIGPRRLGSDEPETMVEGFQRSVAGTLRNVVPYSALTAQLVNPSMDDRQVYLEVNSAWDQLKKGVPQFLGGGTLHMMPSRDPFGVPITAPGHEGLQGISPFKFTKASDDRVLMEMNKVGFFPGKPNRRYKGIDLTQIRDSRGKRTAHDAWWERIGKTERPDPTDNSRRPRMITLKEALQLEIESDAYQSLPAESWRGNLSPRAQRLSSIYADYSGQAFDDILKDDIFPGLAEDVAAADLNDDIQAGKVPGREPTDLEPLINRNK